MTIVYVMKSAIGLSLKMPLKDVSFNCRRKFIAVNPALAKMLGYDGPEEVIFTFQDLKSQLYVNPLDATPLYDTQGKRQSYRF